MIKDPKQTEQSILDILGPLAKTALGEDDEISKKKKLEKKLIEDKEEKIKEDAVNNILSFIESKYSKGVSRAFMESIRLGKEIKEKIKNEEDSLFNSKELNSEISYAEINEKLNQLKQKKLTLH